MFRMLALSLFLFFLPKLSLAEEKTQWPVVLSEAILFPNQFISQDSIQAGYAPEGGMVGETVTWRTNPIGELKSGLGYAGYWRELPALDPGHYEIAFDFATSAYEALLFPKGHPERLIRIGSGKPGVDKNSEIPFLKRQILNFQVQQGDEWILVFNLSNFHRTLGGFWKAPRLAPAPKLMNEAYIKVAFNCAVAGSMFIIMLYTFMLYYRRRTDLPALFLSMTCLAIILRLTGIENISAIFVDVATSGFMFDLSTRLEFASMALVTISFLEFLHHTFPLATLPKSVFRIGHTISAALILLTMVTDPAFFTQWVGVYQTNILLHVTVMFVIAVKAYRRHDEGAGFVLASGLIPLITSVFDVIQSRNGGSSYVAHLGGAVFIFMQSQILAKRFARAYQKAEHLSAHLQQEVELQTLQIRNIMDNVPEGLFTLGKDLRIRGNCSKYVNQIFSNIHLHNLPDLLTLHTLIDRSSLDMTTSVLLSIIGEDSITWDLNGEHLFAELETLDRRKLAFQWHPIMQGSRVAEMLVIVRDTTELFALRERTFHQEQEMILLSSIAKAKSLRYSSFMEQAKDAERHIRETWNIHAGEKDQSYIRLILAHLHTMKGNSRQIGFAQLASEIHGFEQNILDLRDTHGEEAADFRAVLESGLYSIKAELDLIESLHLRYWGEDESPKTRHRIDFVESCLEIEADLSRIAATLGKAAPRLSLDVAQAAEFNSSFQRGLLNSLGHILRNSVAHGIETIVDRQRLGKSEQGVIRIFSEWKGDILRMTVEDDGRGIDRVALLNKVPGKALDLTENLNLILASGLSTSSSVNEVSGRGIGMDSVKFEIERLGGTLEVEARDSYQHRPYPQYIPFRIHLSFPRSFVIRG